MAVLLIGVYLNQGLFGTSCASPRQLLLRCPTIHIHVEAFEAMVKKYQHVKKRSQRFFRTRVLVIASFSAIKKATLFWVALFMAEKEGFEPSIGFKAYTPLAGERLQPLGHFSRFNKLISFNYTSQGAPYSGLLPFALRAMMIKKHHHVQIVPYNLVSRSAISPNLKTSF